MSQPSHQLPMPRQISREEWLQRFGPTHGITRSQQSQAQAAVDAEAEARLRDHLYNDARIEALRVRARLDAGQIVSPEDFAGLTIDPYDPSINSLLSEEEQFYSRSLYPYLLDQR